MRSDRKGDGWRERQSMRETDAAVMRVITGTNLLCGCSTPLNATLNGLKK